MKLGKYTGIRVKRPKVSVSAQDVDAVLKRKQSENSVRIDEDTPDGISQRFEYQDIDDDLARDFSDFDTLTQWRAAIYGEITKRRETAAYNRVLKDILTKIIENSKIYVDDELKQELAEELYEEFLLKLEENNMSMELFEERSKKSREDIWLLKLSEAKRQIEEQQVLLAIAEREALTVSDEELFEEICLLAEDEGQDPQEFADSLGDDELEIIREELLMEMAGDFIVDAAVFI